MRTDVVVIIPCYNEDERLRCTVESVVAAGYSVIVVDDGSEREAWAHVKTLPVHYLRHCINLGQGAALQTGMEYARRLDVAYAVHFDADGQHDVADISRFVAALEQGQADVVIGSRFLRPEDIRQIPFGKRILLRIARIVNGLCTGCWLSDAHNGFRALNRRALERICLTENRMAHATEILSQIKSAGLVLKELPTQVRYTAQSIRKGQKWYNSLNILVELILNKLM